MDFLADAYTKAVKETRDGHAASIRGNVSFKAMMERIRDREAVAFANAMAREFDFHIDLMRGDGLHIDDWTPSKERDFRRRMGFAYQPDTLEEKLGDFLFEQPECTVSRIGEQEYGQFCIDIRSEMDA